MLARYLKAQFWVLLCGGATGPVLIALYFALPSLFGSEVSSYDTSMSSTVSAQFMSQEDNRTYDLSGQAGPLMEILQIYKANNLPFGGTVDIRNYPVVRQQIMAVVRRAAAQQQPAAAGVGAAAAGIAPPQASVAQRLQELETLHNSGALSAEEYASKRAQIISDV